MKYLIIFIILIYTILITSCNNESEININANIPIKAIAENLDSNTNNYNSFYIPYNFLDFLSTKNEKIKLNTILKTISLDGNTDNALILKLKLVYNKEAKKININIDAILEEGNQKLLTLITRLKTIKKSEDFNSKFIFAGTTDHFENIKSGSNFNIKLRPVVTFKGVVIDNENKERVAANLNFSPVKGNDKYSTSFNKNIKSINSGIPTFYGVSTQKQYNIIISAKTNTDKIGFTVLGKEYQEIENLLLDKNSNIYSEYECYKIYLENNTENKKCSINNKLTTESGNLLPGIIIHNSDILSYSKEEIKSQIKEGKGLVSSVSTPSFAKLVPRSVDVDNTSIYYGSIILSGFEINNILTSNTPDTTKTYDGTLRISYDIPKDIESLLSEQYPKKKFLDVFLEYKGPFVLSEINEFKLDDTNTAKRYFIQNRLPFFNLYALYQEPSGQYYKKEISNSELPKLKKLLKLDDGLNNKNTFIGISNLDKLISSLKISKVTFNKELTKYPNADSDNNYFIMHIK